MKSSTGIENSRFKLSEARDRTLPSRNWKETSEETHRKVIVRKEGECISRNRTKGKNHVNSLHFSLVYWFIARLFLSEKKTVNDARWQGQSGLRFYKAAKEEMKHLPDELFTKKHRTLVFINVIILYVSLILLRNFKKNSSILKREWNKQLLPTEEINITEVTWHLRKSPQLGSRKWKAWRGPWSLESIYPDMPDRYF